MNDTRTHRRLAAILAADVVGYSRLIGEDEGATLAALRRLRSELLEPAVADHRGAVVKRVGDGWLVEFSSIVDAVDCARQLQQQLSTDDTAIQLRMGIHIGDVVVADEDIYGDGVNIAVRLQQIAEPNDVVVSEDAKRQLAGKRRLGLQFLGEQRLKNIAQTVRAYRLESEPTESEQSEAAPAPSDGRPVVAVLPFDNMSGEAEQEYFADGTTEDIIIGLSRFRHLFVIARNSTFTYKGRAVKTQQVASELGARYVVEGSVRKSGTRVRVTVQLVEAETGVHLWAERYDRELTDLFDIQDDLTQAIVASLPDRVRAAETDRAKRKPPQDMAALDYLHAGRIHHHRVTRVDNEEAVRLLNKAIELDPQFADAYAWKACVLGQSLEFGFASSVQAVEREALAAVETALTLDANNVECHRLLCEVYMMYKKLDQAEVHGERALALNPNDPRIVAQQGELLTWLGRAGEGVDWVAKSLRLDPFGAPRRAHLMGRALYGARCYSEASDAYRQMEAPRPGPLAELAAAWAQNGDAARAREAAAQVMAMKPDFSSADYVAGLPYRAVADRDHLFEGLRKAELPG